MESEREDYFTGTYLLLVLGSVITVIGFLGFCGAWRESAWMLGTFFTFLLVILIGEICSGIFVYFQPDTIHDIIDKSVSDTVLKKYYYNSSAASVHTFDRIQEELGCCGASGPKDWARSVFNIKDTTNNNDNNNWAGNNNNYGSYKIPRSCCKHSATSCVVATELQITDNPDSTYLYTQGCSEKIKGFFDDYLMVIIMGAIGGILLLELQGMLFSMMLCCTVRRINNMKA